MDIYHGNIAFTPNKDTLSIYENGYIAVEDGKVLDVFKSLPDEYKNINIKDYGESLIIPGFCDMHLHAPQWCNAGVGYSKELIPWLNEYTFPAEARFSDFEFAKAEYKRFVDELVKQGTTRACIFATRHFEATKLLIELLRQKKIAALVGKVNMDRNSIPELEEKTEASIKETKALIEWIRETKKADDNVDYICTPRFVPSTTADLMDALSRLCDEYDLPLQSHLDENNGEIEWVKKLHPESKSFADVYEDHRLLRQNKTIMAHCIHCTDGELKLLKERNVMIAHCPQSNECLSSGIMPVRKYLDMGLRIGLGSDVGAGYSLSMCSQIREAIKCSKLYWYYDNSYKPLTFTEAFFLATKSGGEFFGKVGSFEKGYEFDALVIDDKPIRSSLEHTIEERLERYIYCGDSSCIKERYVSGRCI